jgi:hypothetical protein
MESQKYLERLKWALVKTDGTGGEKLRKIIETIDFYPQRPIKSEKKLSTRVLLMSGIKILSIIILKVLLWSFFSNIFIKSFLF